MCSYSTLQTKRPQPVHNINPLKIAATFNTLMYVIRCSMHTFFLQDLSLAPLSFITHAYTPVEYVHVCIHKHTKEVHMDKEKEWYSKIHHFG